MSDIILEFSEGPQINLPIAQGIQGPIGPQGTSGTANTVTWTAIPFAINSQVNSLGKDWVSNAETLSTDIPGTSSKWVERLSGYNKDKELSSKADLVAGKNIFNKSTAVIGSYVAANSSVTINATYDYSDFIPVIPGTQYKSNNPIRFSCYYDLNKNILSGGISSETTTFTPPTNAVFSKISIYHATLNTFQLEIGSVSTTYEPYLFTVPSNQLDLRLVDYKADLKNVNAYIVSGGAFTINNSGSAFTITIPSGTSVIYGVTTYVTSSQQILNATISGIRHLVFNTTSNLFEITTTENRNNFVYLGILNSYSQRQFINCTSFSVNGLAQDFLIPTTSLNDPSLTKNVSTKSAQYLARNSNCWVIPGGLITVVNIDSAFTIVIPASTTVIVGVEKKVTGALQTINVQVNNIMNLVYDYETNDFKVVSESSRFNYAFVGILNKFSQMMYLNCTNYSVNGISMRLDLISQNSEKVFNLKGKKVVCFGDSVTEFGTYPEQIATITGSTTYKIGFGGCRMARSTSPYYDELSMYKIAQTVASQNFTSMETAVNYIKNNLGDDNTVAFNLLKSIDFSTVDIVTIFFATNDFTANDVAIGVNGSVDTTTLKGAINVTINSLMTAYPNLKILFVTPTHRFFNTSDDSDLVPNGAGNYLIEFVDAIKSESNINHIPALDLYREGGFNKYNHTYYFGTDGVHPNATGYTYLAQKISAKLISLFKF